MTERKWQNVSSEDDGAKTTEFFEIQKQKKDFHYEVYEDTGNDELKHFAVKLSIQEKILGKARATSKKKAEEKASKRAYFALQDKM